MNDGLVAQNIVVRFGGHTALDRITVRAPVGRVTGLIGPNGAGKTTMFNVCSGYQAPAEGTVSIDGRDVTSKPAAERARKGLGRTFQRMQLFGSLTVRENVEFAADACTVSDDPLSMLGLRGGGRKRRAEVRSDAGRLLEMVGLTSLEHRAANELSTGQGRLLELARALARRPRILLLDEPSSGLDGTETRRFGQILRTVVSDLGLGIFLVEHDMSLVLDICEDIEVLDFGRHLFSGTPEEVRSSPIVRAAYLGEEVAGHEHPPPTACAPSEPGSSSARRRTTPLRAAHQPEPRPTEHSA